MRPWILVATFALGTLAGCMAAGPPLKASGPDSPGAARSPLGSPFGSSPASARAWPLILDRADLSLGTTVQFNRVPNVGEIHDLDAVLGLQHLVISLPGWPSDPATLEPLAQMAPETDALVVLPGYPPTRAAAEVWNMIPARLRLVVLVDGPPPSIAVVSDLNVMRGLDRVIAQMDRPSRAGFERLQRPLSFRKIVE